MIQNVLQILMFYALNITKGKHKTQVTTDWMIMNTEWGVFARQPLDLDSNIFQIITKKKSNICYYFADCDFYILDTK